MKAICLLLTGILLMPPVFIRAQDTIPDYDYGFPFAKGKIVYDLQRNLNYRNYNNYQNDVKYSESSAFNIDLGFDYMFKNKWGIGFDLSVGSSTTKNGSENKNSDWMAWLNFTYGMPLNQNVSWYVKPSVGYGSEKDTYTSTAGSSEDKYNTLGFRINTGLPIQVQGGPVYLNPNITYKRYCIDFEDGEESMNRFSIGLSLMAAMTDEEFMCDSKRGHPQAAVRYDQGSSYLSYYTKGMYSTGSTETQYNNFPDKVKSDFSGSSLRFDYAYYPVNNLYGGVELMLGSSVSKPGLQQGYEYRNTDFMIIPKIGYNISGKAPLNNTFIELGVGFGYDKLKIDDNGNVNESKDKTFYYGVSAGYNIFIGDQVAVTPMVRYSMYNYESTTSTNPQEQESKGFGARIGARFFLGK